MDGAEFKKEKEMTKQNDMPDVEEQIADGNKELEHFYAYNQYLDACHKIKMPEFLIKGYSEFCRDGK